MRTSQGKSNLGDAGGLTLSELRNIVDDWELSSR